MKALALAFLALFLVFKPGAAFAADDRPSIVHLPPPSEILSMISSVSESEDKTEAPKLVCPKNAKICAFAYRFSERIQDDSVGKFQAFVQAAQKAGGKAIMLELNTGGGDLDSGFEMIRTIEMSSIRFVCVADGTVASEGFAVLQSCDIRYMTKRTVLMTHNVLMHRDCHGDGIPVTLIDAKKMYDDLYATSGAFAEQILRRAKNIGMAEYRAKIDKGDWTMGHEEALHYGFVDHVWDGIPNSLYGKLLATGKQP